MAVWQRVIASALGAFLVVEAAVGTCTRPLQVVLGLSLVGVVNLDAFVDLIRRPSSPDEPSDED